MTPHHPLPLYLRLWDWFVTLFAITVVGLGFCLVHGVERVYKWFHQNDLNDDHWD